jgi:hypothetical protein
MNLGDFASRIEKAALAVSNPIFDTMCFPELCSYRLSQKEKPSQATWEEKLRQRIIPLPSFRSCESSDSSYLMLPLEISRSFI